MVHESLLISVYSLFSPSQPSTTRESEMRPDRRCPAGKCTFAAPGKLTASKTNAVLVKDCYNAEKHLCPDSNFPWYYPYHYRKYPRRWAGRDLCRRLWSQGAAKYKYGLNVSTEDESSAADINIDLNKSEESSEDDDVEEKYHGSDAEGLIENVHLEEEETDRVTKQRKGNEIGAPRRKNDGAETVVHGDGGRSAPKQATVDSMKTKQKRPGLSLRSRARQRCQ